MSDWATFLLKFNSNLPLKRTFYHFSFFFCSLSLVLWMYHIKQDTNNKEYAGRGRLQQDTKVKQSHYRPGHALRVPECWGSQIWRQSAHVGGKVGSPTHWPPLPPRKYFWYSFLLEAVWTPGLHCGREGLCQWKISMTTSEIEPATFRIVAQCLNQLCHHRTVGLSMLEYYWPHAEIGVT